MNIEVKPFEIYATLSEPTDKSPWDWKTRFARYWGASSDYIYLPKFAEVFYSIRHKIPNDFKGKGKRNRKK